MKGKQPEKNPKPDIKVAPDPADQQATAEMPMVRPERKIAIVGFTASKDEAPWGQPGWEIWICNNLWKHCPEGWHRVYDLHPPKDVVQDKEHEAFLRGLPQQHINGSQIALADRPVYCFKPQPEWPTAKAFPQDEIIATLGDYFTNSISWMIAHALMEGATELHVYGVDMATGGEYASQRPSCEYLLGIAVGMGVKVHVPLSSDLLKLAALYGTEGDSALHAKLVEREKELSDRIAQVRQNKEVAIVQEAQIQGALETTRYFKEVWTNPRATSRHEESTESQNGAVPKEVVKV